MSEAVIPQQPDPFPGTRTPNLWLIVLIAVASAAALVGLMMMFTGRISVFDRAPPTAPAPHVILTPNTAPVERPAIAPADVHPAAAHPQPQPHPGYNLPSTDEQKKARESPIGAYAISPSNAAAATTKSGAANDPEELPAANQPDALEASLVPTKITGTRVSELPNPRWLVEEGRVLPCVQVTKINSALPGAVTAIIPEEIRGETSDVVVMPKGAKVFGTIQHALVNGLDRQAVLWQDVTTPVLYDDRGMPHQFRVAVNSPASSPLGEIGLDGNVNRHLFNPFPGKLGAILGMSLMQGGIQAGVNAAQRQGNGNTSLNFNSFQSGGSSATDALLHSYISIPDTLERDQGTRCAIFVVRDLDFKGISQLVQRYRTIR